MILVVDCRDSFVHNLVAMIRSSGAETLVIDETDIDGISGCKPDAVVLSPGPGRPSPERGSWHAFNLFRGRVPILGVCLGLQTVCAACGGGIVRGDTPVHGKVVSVRHGGTGLMEGMPQDFRAVRYNSLKVDPWNPGMGIRIDAFDDRGDVMAVSCENEDVFAVQFHPESFLTEHGRTIVDGFLRRAGL